MKIPPPGDPLSELLQLAGMTLALVLLLLLGNRLSAWGVFDPMKLERRSHGPLLVAITPLRDASPGAHHLMRAIYAAAYTRGVEEEASMLGDEAATVTRGELLGVYHGAVRPFMKAAPAEVGVVIDVGENRVNPDTRAAWQARFDGKEELGEVTVRVVQVGEAMSLPLKWKDSISETVAQWRGLRKIAKNWRKLPPGQRKGEMNVLVQTFSERRGRVLSVVPLDSTKSIYQD